MSPSGALYVVREAQYPEMPGSSLLKIDVATGIIQQQIPLPTTVGGYLYGSGYYSGIFTTAAYVSAPMVAADGSVYLGVSSIYDVVDFLQGGETYDNPVQLLQVSPDGTVTWTTLAHYTFSGSPGNPPQVGLSGTPYGIIEDVIPDGQGGVLAGWSKGSGIYPNQVIEAHVTRVSPSGLTDYTMPFGEWGNLMESGLSNSLALGENGVAFGVGYTFDPVSFTYSDPSVASFNIADGSVNWSTPLSGVVSCLNNPPCPVNNGIVAATEGNGLILEEPVPSGTSFVDQIVQFDSTGQLLTTPGTSSDPAVFTIQQPDYYSNGVWLGLLADPAAAAMIGPMDPMALGPWPEPAGNRNRQRSPQKPELAHFVPTDPGSPPPVYPAAQFKAEMVSALPSSQVTHSFFLNADATIPAFLREVNIPNIAVAFIGHSYDIALQPPQSGISSVGLCFFGTDMNSLPCLAKSLPQGQSYPANVTPIDKIRTEARIIFVASCALGDTFESLWDINQATNGRALVVSTNETVDLVHASRAWIEMATELASGKNISSAVEGTNSYMASLGLSERWEVVGDGSVRIK